MKRTVFAILALFLLPFIVHAQDSDGTLTLNQPLIAEIAAGETLTYDYTLNDARVVRLQAFGQTAQPRMMILKEDVIIAGQPNSEGALTILLDAILDAGVYTVEVSTVNETSGQVVLVLASEVAVPTETVLPNVPISASVNPDLPMTRYTFSAAPQDAILVVESVSDGDGIRVTVSDALTNESVASFRPPVTGARFNIPAGTTVYNLSVTFGGSIAAVDPNAREQVYSVCLEVDFSGACDAQDSQPIQTVAPTIVAPTPTFASTVTVPPTEVVGTCTVTPNVPSVNVRQSASLNAPIVGALTTGTSATVIGISPDDAWYDIQFSSLNGWVSLSVVTATGNCANIPVVQPPPFAPPQATQVPTVPAQPTQPPPPPSPTQSGPCLITMTGEALIYQQPTADPSFIQDEVQPGYELIPIGRLADNSWWKTNYANAWIQTSLFGSVAQVTGDCSGLAIVSP